MRAMIGVSLIAAAAVGPGTPCLAQKVDFSGAKIALAIATPPGGGYDLYGRLVGRFLGAYLPGNPTVVPQNMPGAGSLIAANWLYNVAPRDGTAIGIMPSATAFENLLGNASAGRDISPDGVRIRLGMTTAVSASRPARRHWSARRPITRRPGMPRAARLPDQQCQVSWFEPFPLAAGIHSSYPGYVLA